MFTVIWKFEVREMFTAAFEELYGQSGKWVQLFQTGNGYVGTQLLHDVDAINQYITIDTWQSEDLYEKFLEEHKDEFAVIDADGEKLTTSETKIGWFADL